MPLDHTTADSQRTASKEAAYWSILQSTLKQSFTSFVHSLATQSLAQQHLGRVAKVEFQPNGNRFVHTFANAEELRAELDHTQTTRLTTLSEPVNRKLYILEDLGRSHVEILGSCLVVPPSFFAAQWSDPSLAVATFDQETLTRRRTQVFQLLYPVLHQFKLGSAEGECPPGLYIDSQNNIPRLLQPLDEHRAWEISKHQISFWSATTYSDSWTGESRIDDNNSDFRLMILSRAVARRSSFK